MCTSCDAPGPIFHGSIVEKPDDKATDTLTIPARVGGDLKSLRDRHLPTLGPITANAGTDYPYRAKAPRVDVTAALQQAVADLHNDNFKSAVAKGQGRPREAIYDRVWSVLAALPGQ